MKHFLISLLILLVSFSPAFAEKRIAVLPFEVPESRPDLKQYGVGITDTITIALSNIKDFIMIDRTQFQTILKEQSIQNSGLISPEKIVSLGKLLGAEILVIGAIQIAGNDYRITARLTEVETGKIIKAVQVTGTSIFDLQDKLAEEVISQQNVTVSDSILSRIKKIVKPTNNVNAYEYYLKGKALVQKATIKSYQEAIKNFNIALKSDSNYTLALAAKSEAQALLSFELELRGKQYKDILKEAEDNANNALNQRVEIGDIHRALSTIYKLQGKFDNAKEEARKALELNSNDTDAKYLLWSSSINKTDNREMMELISSNDFIFKKHLALGYAYFKQNKYRDAINIFNEVIKIDPDYVYAYIGLGYSYEKINDYDSAEFAFKQTVSINKSLADGYAGLGLVAFRKGKLKESLKLFNKSLENNSNYSFGHSGLGYVYFEMGNMENSFEEYKIAIEINPDDFYARNGLGSYYFKKGMYNQALEQFRTVLGINYTDADAHYNIALVYHATGNEKDAVKELKEVLLLYPDFIKAYFKLAEIYENSQMFDDAVSQYKQIIRLNPGDTNSLNKIGILYYKNKKYPEAISFYKKALSINFEDASAHNNLGIVYYLQGKINDAVSEYKEALRINPDDISANENIAFTYELLGKKTEAKYFYAKTCELGKKEVCEWLRNNPG